MSAMAEIMTGPLAVASMVGDLTGRLNEQALQNKDLRQRVERLEGQVMNPLAGFDNDGGDSADLRIANEMLKAQNANLRRALSEIDDENVALRQKIKGVEAVLAVTVGAI